MKPSLRQVSADYHVSAVAIAVLICWSLYWGFMALWNPVVRAADFLVTAVAILGIPHESVTFTPYDRVSTLAFLFDAFACLAAAWLLSLWVYGTGPLRSLTKCRTRLTRTNHV